MPVSFTSFAHLATSARTCSPNCSGVFGAAGS
jgi:hypothetical protein